MQSVCDFAGEATQRARTHTQTNTYAAKFSEAARSIPTRKSLLVSPLSKVSRHQLGGLEVARQNCAAFYEARMLTYADVC
jgi:hypothetical protein